MSMRKLTSRYCAASSVDAPVMATKSAIKSLSIMRIGNFFSSFSQE
jgi:hypothetical protein